MNQFTLLSSNTLFPQPSPTNYLSIKFTFFELILKNFSRLLSTFLTLSAQPQHLVVHAHCSTLEDIVHMNLSVNDAPQCCSILEPYLVPSVSWNSHILTILGYSSFSSHICDFSPLLMLTPSARNTLSPNPPYEYHPHPKSPRSRPLRHENFWDSQFRSCAFSKLFDYNKYCFCYSYFHMLNQ